MALNKRTYTDGITVITAGNLNDIQDAIIALEGQDIPAPYNSNPEAPGEASPGTSDEFARGDHVHPLPPVDSALSDSSTNPVQNKVIKAALDDKADIIVSSATGAVASFSDGADGLPVKDLTIRIEPVQSGSGDPSPNNVRIISGRTGANVWDDPVHGGSIVWNQYIKELNGTNFTASKGSATYTDGVARYEITEVGTTSYANRLSTNYSYTAYENHIIYTAFTHRENKDGMRIAFTYVASNTGTMVNSSTDWVRSETITQIASGGGGTNKWIAFSYYEQSGGSVTRAVGDWFEVKDAIYVDLTQMFGAGNEPTTVDEFKALFPKEYYDYNNGTTTCVSAVNGDPYWTEAISWQSEAGTVYAGTRDLTTGVLIADKRMFDLGSISYHWSNTVNHFMAQSNLTHLVLPPSNAYAMDAVCDCYKVISYKNFNPSTTDNAIFIPGSGTGGTKYLRIMDSRFSHDADGAAALKTALSGHYLCYKVDNPTTYQFMAQHLSTLPGNNNIFADTGDTTVQYRADTKLYIAAIEDENRQLRLAIAPIEDGATASQAYAQGKYFFRNGSFCKAKTSIASGASFTLNTNYEVTTVSAELFAALNS